jgi:hypothetical protein
VDDSRRPHTKFVDKRVVPLTARNLSFALPEGAVGTVRQGVE